jgi:LysM repeat protein
MKRKTAKRLFNGSVAVILLAVGFSMGKLAKADYKPTETTTETITVHSGDTLWSIAETYAEGDVRAYISRIKKLNNIDSALIYPGQQLKVIVE